MGRDELPAGTVTFLFTDVEGSTRLLHELGPERYAHALAAHRRAIRACCARHGGVEVDTQGDAFFVAFPTAPGALAAAAEVLAALADGPIRVRMGIHTGTPHRTAEGYVGVDIHRAARIAASGHGGQVLVSAASAALVDGTLLRDLGEHRLKDLAAPERIYQLGNEEFRPLRSLHRTNLPVPAAPFVGRERELVALAELLAEPDGRLLTLTGPGGTGKTRLALQAAAAAADHFPAGVFWVPLAALRDPAFVLESAARAAGATEGLVEHVGDRALLLLLDNFEHVVEAATELPGLIAACPRLRLLVTSRELLRVPGERVFEVDPLVPADAAELFLARARARAPSIAHGHAVEELCARLEHLPLALELAAARARVLPPETLIERLGGRLDLLRAGRGADPRQQTLRATIEWSHDLLGEEEQQLFARLAVFVGGWTLEAVESVCDADLDALESLVDKSLVRVRDDGRFWMLETIRELAVERLERSGEADRLRRRHARHFLALAEAAEPQVAQFAKHVLDSLAAEVGNLRSAFEAFSGAGETQAALRLAAAVGELLTTRGHLLEVERLLERALAADERRTAARGKALNRAADVARDTETARRRAEEARAIHLALGDDAGLAESLLQLGSAAEERDDIEEACRLFDESALLFRACGHTHGALLAARMLAWMHRRLGDDERARALYAEVLREARETRDGHMEAQALEALAGIALDRGDAATAAAMVDAAYRIHEAHDDRFRLPIGVCRFASVVAAAGLPLTAAELLGAGEALCAETGADVQWVRTMNDEYRARIRSQLPGDVFDGAWATGRRLSLEEAVTLARASLQPDR